MEKLLAENLPVPTEKVVKLNKALRRAKWMKRFNEVRIAEKVKLKTLENLAKDSNH